MHREIKFRAWVYDLLCKRIMVYDLEIKDCGWVNDVLSDERYLMQFTGLRDSIGAEIYEGDIVHHSRLEENGIVYFDTEKASYMFTPIPDYYKKAYTKQLYCYIKDIQVIGNIYENMELLKNLNNNASFAAGEEEHRGGGER